MRKIIVISLCEQKKKKGYLFHFKGAFYGHKIKGIMVNTGQYICGEAYILALTNIIVDKGIIYGECIKSKKIFN